MHPPPPNRPHPITQNFCLLDLSETAGGQFSHFLIPNFNKSSKRKVKKIRDRILRKGKN